MAEPVDSYGMLFWVAPLPPQVFSDSSPFFKLNCFGKMAWSSSNMQSSPWSAVAVSGMQGRTQEAEPREVKGACAGCGHGMHEAPLV